MFESLEKYISGASNLYTAFGVEVGKFALGKAYEHLKSPRPKISDAFILGYYLPWLAFANGLSNSVFSENTLALFDKFTTESYVFEAATNLHLEDVDRDYVYNIKSNALVEKYSISKKLPGKYKEGKEFLAFNLAISLSESIILFNQTKERDRCVEEAEKWASKFGAQSTVESLNLRDRSSFVSDVEKFAIEFIQKA